MRRKDREITEIDEILKIVEKSKILHLGLFDNGFPYIVPLHFGYEYLENKFVFYIHCAKEGHKLELIKMNPNVCVEMECDVELVSGEDIACNYGSSYASLIGRGCAKIVQNNDEKITGLSLLMKNQTSRIFDITHEQASTVEVIKIIIPEFTAKSKPKKT